MFKKLIPSILKKTQAKPVTRTLETSTETPQSTKLTAQQLYDLGDQHFISQDLNQAVSYYIQSLELDPGFFKAHKRLGNAYYYQKRLDEAIRCYEQAIKLNPDYAEAYCDLGLALSDTHEYELALDKLSRAIAINPELHFAYYNCGLVFNKLKKSEEALASFDQVIALKPDNSFAYNNRGIALKRLDKLQEALASYERAIELNPKNIEAMLNRGDVLRLLGMPRDALESFDDAISLNSSFAEAYNSRGAVLIDLNRLEEALDNLTRAAVLKPELLDAHTNRVIALRKLRRLDEALACCEHALTLSPDSGALYSHKGYILKDLQRLPESLTYLARAIELMPEIALCYGYWLEVKYALCDWNEHNKHIESLEAQIAKGWNVAQPLCVLWLSSSASVQKQIAEIAVKYTYPESQSLPPIAKIPKHKKIRLGYFSGDFSNHAVAILTAQLFELHDKSKFEIIAFSLSSVRDNVTTRLEQAFDQYIDVSKLTDEGIALLARKMDIDIAVDLSGLTTDSRMGIFALRVAPIQINYLGFPGTLGAGYMDYIIADNIVIPEEYRHHYVEKILYLPSFQVNDSKRYISDRKFTREELGFPSQGFVFCCFNNSVKLNPNTFDSWMRILGQVKDSILWLIDNNSEVVSNLKKEAKLRGIDPGRLVFAKRLPVPDYLARYRMADLFLDTLPFNAGTTASDALWAGLPVLTQIGEAFSSRMAASLLNAIHLPELITKTTEEYEALAIELATNPEKLANIKQKLSDNRLNTPLFDTECFARNLEDGYTQIYERYQAGLLPDHIYSKGLK